MILNQHRVGRSGCSPLLAALCVVAASGAAVGAPSAEVVRIGTSAEGRPVEVIAIGEAAIGADGLSRDERPALVIVAGMQGHHAVGRATARAVGERLMRDHPDLLSGRTVYILAEANPDGAARWSDQRGPVAESGRAPATLDEDADGRTNEDGPNDLNGDGLITMMRVRGAIPAYGIEPSLMIDPDEPRLKRKPDAAKGEVATHSVWVEGIDDDGDGRFNEDGWGGASGGGVDFDRHFPIHWPEHEDGAGLYPLQRPAARAVVEWAQSRGNIVGVLVYGPHDTLASVPPAGKFGPVGRVSTGIENDDKSGYELVSEAFKKASGISKSAGEVDRGGSFLQWSYADLGVWTFGTPVWVRPDLMGSGGGKDDASAGEPEPSPLDEAIARDRAALAERGVPQELIAFIHATTDERAAIVAEMDAMTPEERNERMNLLRNAPMDVQQRVMALAQGQPDPMAPKVEPVPEPEKPAAKPKKRGDSDEAKWLAWIDDERAGSGFVEWTEVDHPQLGTVEVGGFAPGVRVNPPEESLEGLADKQAAFVAELLGMLPTLVFDEPRVERVGDGLWRVSLTARNTGSLATVPASGVKARRLPGLIMALDPDLAVPNESIVSGRRVQTVETIAPGGEARAEWMIAGDEGSSVRIAVRSARFGDRGFDVRLGEGGGR